MIAPARLAHLPANFDAFAQGSPFSVMARGTVERFLNPELLDSTGMMATSRRHLHRVASWEAEEAFFNRPLIVTTDRKHFLSEQRHLALGQRRPMPHGALQRTACGGR